MLVELATLLGAHYRFPDMPRAEVEMVLHHAESTEDCATLAMHNVSGAVMVLPWKIISQILCDGEVRWSRHKSGA